MRLRARKGYWAPTPDEIQRANLLAHANDPRPPVPLPPARHIEPADSAVVRHREGSEREHARDIRLGAGRRRARGSSRPHAVARRVEGARHRRHDAVRRTGAARQAPSPSTAWTLRDARAVFEVPPGRDPPGDVDRGSSASQPIDTDVREILVGDLRAPVAIGTPEVLRARTARDVRALDANPDAVPVSSREFSRAEQLVIRVPGVRARTDAPTVIGAAR